jgi:Fe-S oxidoreductase
MTLEDRRDNLVRCDRCSHCKWTPGMPSGSFASACPSIEYGQFHSYSGSGKTITAFAVLDHKLDGYSDETLRGIYACSACGACETACQWSHADMVGPLDNLYALRERVVADGAALPAHRASIEALARHGNRYGRPASERSAWAEGLGLKDILQQPARVLLHVGSDNACERSQWPELRHIVTLLQRAGVDFGLLFDAEPDSGGHAFDLGFTAHARRSAQATAALIAQSKAECVVTCSAESHWAFLNVYPRLGVKLPAVRVEHIVQTIDELVSAGKLTLPPAPAGQSVSYHDSCKLGRLSEPHPEWKGRWTQAMNQICITEPKRPIAFGNSGVYDAPRRLIDRVSGQRVEFQRHHQFAYCCGALGGGKEAYPDFARHAARQRLAEASACGAAVVVSACGACTGHLREVARAEGLPVQVQGLFELLARTEAEPHAATATGTNAGARA